jgi:hypothetical protein
MKILKWFIIVLAVTEAGWMAFDGMRALVIGDYVTPQSGEYAGQLGPWAKVFSAIGIAPRSTLMKSIFVAYGVAWLAIIAAFARGTARAKQAMLAAAIGSLWYLVIGAATSVLLIILLMIYMKRGT